SAGHVLELCELDIPYKLTGGQFDAQQLTHEHDIFVRHPNEPHQRCEHRTEYGFQGKAVIRRIGGYPIVESGEVTDPAQNTIDHGNKSNEHQEHGTHVEGEFQAFCGAIGNGVQDVGTDFFRRDLDIGIDGLGLRIQYFRDHNGSWCGHNGCGQQVFGKDQPQFGVAPAQKTNVGGEYGTRHSGHSPDHDQQDLRSVHFFQIGL